MRKILLTLLALLSLGGNGAWATDVTELPTLTTDVNSPKLYVVKNTRSNLYAAYRYDTEQMRQIADLSSATFWYFTEGTGTTNENQISVKMRNYFADGKALNSTSLNAFDASGINIAIVPRPSSDGVYLDLWNNSYNYDDGYHTALNDGASTSITVWGAKDAGSCFVITPVDDIIEDLRTQYSARVDGCATLTALFSSSDCTTAKTAITNATTGLEVITAYENLIATANNKLVSLKSYSDQQFIAFGNGIITGTTEGIIKVVSKRDLLALQDPETNQYIGLSPTAQSTRFTLSSTPEYFQMKFNASYEGYACFASSNARTSSGTLTMHQNGSSQIVTWYDNAANSFFQPAAKTVDNLKVDIIAKLDAISGWQPIYSASDITTAKTDINNATTVDEVNTIYENAIFAANGKLIAIENYQNTGKYMSINATNVTTKTYPTVVKLLVNSDLTYSLQGYLNFESYYAEQLQNVNYTYVASSETAGKYRLGLNDTKGFLFYSTEHDGCLHYSNGNIVRWYDNADASYWTISEVTDAAYLGSYYDALLIYQSNYGEYGYYKSGTTTKAQFDDAISGCSTILNDLSGQAANISMGKMIAKGIYDTGFTPVVPVAGDFLRIKASDTNKSAWSLSESDLYLTSSNCTSNAGRAGFAEGAAPDNTTIFYFDGNYLTGYANGLQTINASNFLKIGDVGAEATKVNFDVIYSTEDHAYRVEFNNGGRSLYTQRGGSEGSYFYYTDAASADATDAHYRYVLEKVTSLPVTISSAGYATLYAPVALTIPSGVTAYTATEGRDYLTLTAIDGGIIPANTGVILKGVAGTYDFTITTGGSVGGNALTGTVAAIVRTKTDDLYDSYILSTSNGTNVGFYRDGASTIPGFKAYLPAAGAGGNVKPFRFGTEDAIQAIAADGKAEFFDLSGRQVSKPARGLYIVNGKKVIVK